MRHDNMPAGLADHPERMIRCLSRRGPPRVGDAVEVLANPGTIRRAPGLVALVVLAVACAGSSTTGPTAGQVAATAASPTSPPPATPLARGVVITTSSSDYGPMLFDGHGQAIYLFAKERTTKPECYDACAHAWPPVLTEG